MSLLRINKTSLCLEPEVYCFHLFKVSKYYIYYLKNLIISIDDYDL